MKLLVVFRGRLNAAGGLTRWTARSAYTAYIIHPFFVVCGTYFLTYVDADPLLKFPILCLMAVTSCFLVSNLIRQAPLLRRIL